MGSAAIDLAYVAAGRYEGFWEVSLNPWDVAAGALLVEEAGGILRGVEITRQARGRKAPADWIKTYPGATFEVVSPENYLDFVT